ncbi:hypothetical protein ZTR_02890 [Talaromyces verruculosus]|nr:hypothetical protein ZTR_02890 [Talaromyces verruculosus]
MADSEFDEAGRAELIREIADIIYKSEQIRQPSSLWAFLWLADLPCLERIKERLLTERRPLEEFARLTRDVVLPWLYKDKGKAKSATATPTQSVTNTPASKRSRASSISPMETRSKKTRMESPAVQSSPPAVAGSSIPPNSSLLPADPIIPKQWRDSDLREQTLERDLHCVISLIENPAVLECTHIYPNSLGSTGYKLAFWDRLRMFWSETKVSEWATLLGTLQGTERLLNTMTLNVMAHKAWGQGLFAFKHVETSEASTDGQKMDLEFYWLKPRVKTPKSLTKEDFIKRPLLPSNEACGDGNLHFHNVRTSQPVKSGDIITMRTPYPIEQALPSKALIDLQWYLNRIAALTAAATEFELKLFSDDDDDEVNQYHGYVPRYNHRALQFMMSSHAGIDAMTAPDIPPIPPRISSLIPQEAQQKIAEHDKQVRKQKSNVSLLSIKSSISDYLEEKFKECEYDLAASVARLSALQQAVEQGTLTQEEYYNAATPFFEYQKERFDEKKHLSQHRRFLEADMSEEVESKKLRFDEPSIEFYQRAYANSIVPRVMNATGRQPKTNFDSKRFRWDLLNEYDALDPGNGCPRAWCHSLTAPEIGYLFGVKQVPDDFFYNWRLGITLHKNIESALDQGEIVIVPKPVGDETRWECILVDQAKADQTALILTGGQQLKWKELHHKELVFRGEKRPARRYLYFRFIITVLHAMRKGNDEFISELQKKDEFWPSPGEYLQRATLVALAKNISGLNLPESVLNDTTFSENVDDNNPLNTSMILAADLRDAALESAKKAKELADSDYEFTESEDETDDEMMDDLMEASV